MWEVRYKLAVNITVGGMINGLVKIMLAKSNYPEPQVELANIDRAKF
jgi:hypothetical protein